MHEAYRGRGATPRRAAGVRNVKAGGSCRVSWSVTFCRLFQLDSKARFVFSGGRCMKRLMFGLAVFCVLFPVHVPSHVRECLAFGGFPSATGYWPARLPSGDMTSYQEPARKENDPVRFSVGWLEHSQGLTLSNDLPELLGGITNIRPSALRGVWISLTISAALADRVALELSGAALLARQSGGLITSNIGSTADFEGAGLEWSYLQSLFRWDVGRDFSVLAGVRWDHTKERLHVTRPPSSNDDFIVNGYMPLVGVQVRQESPAGHISLRVLGFPAVPGNIKFHTWSETSTYSQESDQDFSGGHCLEVDAEYGRRISGTVDASLFGRWDLLHATTSVENALVPAPVRAIRWTMDRRSWTLGMGISCSLNFP